MNIFDGILPDFTLLGGDFTQLWQKILAIAWGMAFVVTGIAMIVGFARMGWANKEEMPGQAAKHQQGAKKAGIATACLAAIPVIFGAIIFAAGA